MNRLLGAVLLIGFVLAAACSQKQKDAVIRPLPPPSDETTTTVADLSGVQLAGVAGRTTTTAVPVGPGGATISGTVIGPNGPVPGAIVHVERLVGDAVGAIDVATNAAGQYSVPNVLGGRYRVRAFAPDPVDLAQTQPTIFFLGGNEQKPLNLQVNLFAGLSVSSAIAPNQSQTVVQVTTQSVDPKGVVRGQPVPGVKVELVGTGSWRVLTDNPTVTADGGRAAFLVRCVSDGPQPLSAAINDTVNQPIDIPGCVPPPPTTTTETPTTAAAPAATTTTALLGTTTTTRRPASTTTSTTTKKQGNGNGGNGGAGNTTP